MPWIEDRSKGRSREMAVVVHPPSNNRVELASQLFQALVTTVVQLPTTNDIPHPLGRLHTDCRSVAQEQVTSWPANHSRLKGRPQEVEFDIAMVPLASAILAVDNPGLFRVECQPACLHPLSNALCHLCGLALRNAMNNNIVAVPLKGNVRMISAHPLIKGIMQEEIGKQGTDNPALGYTLLPFHQRTVFHLYRRFEPPFNVKHDPLAVGVLSDCS